MMASGEFPDTGAPFDLDTLLLYQDQVIRSVPETMIREHAPAYSRAMDSRYTVVWKWMRAKDNPAEQLGMGAIAGTDLTGPFYQFIRKDWLDNLGVSIPGDYESGKQLVNRSTYYYEHPSIDLEWVEDTLVAFRDGDGDQNGKVDTIPFGAYTVGTRPYDDWAWGAIHGALGLPMLLLDRNQIVDGTLYVSSVSPRFRDFIKLAKRWWDMGLLDNEWFTISRVKNWEKSRTGVFGMVTSNWNYVGRKSSRPPDTLMSDEDIARGAELIMFAPRGPGGHQFANMYGTSYLSRQVQVFNKKADDALVAKVLEIQDTKYRVGDGTNEGVRLHLSWLPGWGQEGVHWTWSGEPYESTAVKIDKADIPAGVPKEGGFFTNYPNYSPPEEFKAFYAPAHYDFFVNHLNSPRIQSQTFATERVDIFGETDFVKVKERYGAALGTMTDEFFTKAVTGEIDVDAEWDNYVNDWMRAGGDALMAEIEKMPRWDDIFRK
jgi:hypothetical protein